MKSAMYGTEGVREISYTCGSDYSGGLVQYSNYTILSRQLSRCKGVYRLYGDYGTYGIGYKPEELTKATKALIKRIEESLEKYPALDDELVSEIEYKLILKSYYRERKREVARKDYDKAKNIILGRIGDIAIVEEGCRSYIDWDKVKEELENWT